MKVCPRCDRDYGDEAGFCLMFTVVPQFGQNIGYFFASFGSILSSNQFVRSSIDSM